MSCILGLVVAPAPSDVSPTSGDWITSTKAKVTKNGMGPMDPDMYMGTVEVVREMHGGVENNSNNNANVTSNSKEFLESKKPSCFYSVEYSLPQDG